MGMTDKQLDRHNLELKAIGDQVETMADNLEDFAGKFDRKTDERIAGMMTEITKAMQEHRAPNLFGSGDGIDSTDDGGFSNFGEMVDTLRFNPSDTRIRRMAQETRDMSTGTGTGGGFAVPSSFVPSMFQVPQAQSIFRSRISMIPRNAAAPDAPLSFPCLDQSGSNGLTAGVEVSYVAEGGAKPETAAKLNMISLEPLEIAGKIIVTDKLLRNWSASSTLLPNLLGQAMTDKIEEDIYSGTGAGQILGYSTHSSAIHVDRAVASQVCYVDLAQMLSQAVFSLGELVWVVSHSTLPYFMSMTDGAGQLLWLQSNSGINYEKGKLFSFLGLPLFVLDNAETLGNDADVSLIAPKALVGTQGSGPFIESSQHVYFENNKTVIRCSTNFDCKPWLTAPLTLGDGTEVSPIVVLDADVA